MIPPEHSEPDSDAESDAAEDTSASAGLQGSAEDPDWKPAPLGPLLGVIGALTASNVLANVVLPDWAYVPWNLAVAAGVVGIAMRADGQTMASMGLSRAAAPKGLKLGISFSAALVGVYAIGLAIPSTRGLFLDERADVPFMEMAFK
ncbi:MAG: hypothetical protein ACR2OH_05795, partial [Microthrixaceae bacterium]